MASRCCNILLLLGILAGFGVTRAHPKQCPSLPFLTEEDFARAAALKYGDPKNSNYTRVNDQDYYDERSQTRLAGRNQDWKWRNARVPYVLDPKLSEDERSHIAASVHEYESKTCVRFVPKETSDNDFVEILRDDGVCGLSTICKIGGRQEVKFGGECINSGTLNHELGHTLCFLHEHVRPDRDDYISWDTSKCSPPYQVSSQDWTTFGLYYDYVSIQHYEQECYNGCIAPKMDGVTKCGSGGTLSVLDAEKINNYYDCPGCLSYRFRPKSEITYAEEDNLLVAGYDWGGHEDKLFICRAYFNGDIIPGRGRLTGWCSMAYNGEEQWVREESELFTVPDGANFRWERHTGGRTVPENAVAGGRTAEREPLYIGRCELQLDDRKVLVPGKFHPQTSEKLIVSYNEVWECEEFELLLC